MRRRLTQRLSMRPGLELGDTDTEALAATLALALALALVLSLSCSSGSGSGSSSECVCSKQTCSVCVVKVIVYSAIAEALCSTDTKKRAVRAATAVY